MRPLSPRLTVELILPQLTVTIGRVGLDRHASLISETPTVPLTLIAVVLPMFASFEVVQVGPVGARVSPRPPRLFLAASLSDDVTGLRQLHRKHATA